MTHKKNTAIKIFIENLVSVRLTVVLIFILVPVIMAGSFIPQGRSFSEYAGAYGIQMTKLLYRVHLDSVYQSPWFLVLVLLLGMNVTGCFLKSLIGKKRSLGFYLVHIGLIVMMAGGMLSAAGRIHGKVRLYEGESAASFEYKKKTIPLGFELRLKDFEYRRYENQGPKLKVFVPDREMPLEFAFRPDIWTAILGTAYRFRVEQAVLDFRYDMNSKTVFSASDEPKNPAVLVHVLGPGEDYSQWVFSHFAEFHGKTEKTLIFRYQWAPDIPKAFISHVEVLEGGKVIKEQAIEVNKPLRHKGFSVYQSSYDSQEQKWTGLEAVKDPGTGLVYASIVVIMLGLVLNIYIIPLLKKEKADPKIKEF